ncbi:MAG: hypothetical protein HYT46_00920 [Candidatus Vogelbacteria bacterium]|nr:hypothetical protein [Candidatus Vogelbacteria bacterium]
MEDFAVEITFRTLVGFAAGLLATTEVHLGHLHGKKLLTNWTTTITRRKQKIEEPNNCFPYTTHDFFSFVLKLKDLFPVSSCRNSNWTYQLEYALEDRREILCRDLPRTPRRLFPLYVFHVPANAQDRKKDNAEHKPVKTLNESNFSQKLHDFLLIQVYPDFSPATRRVRPETYLSNPTPILS